MSYRADSSSWIDDMLERPVHLVHPADGRATAGMAKAVQHDLEHQQARVVDPALRAVRQLTRPGKDGRDRRRRSVRLKAKLRASFRSNGNSNRSTVR
jgi:hypothetical protein